jgi:Domain of unknown function (DUF1906)
MTRWADYSAGQLGGEALVAAGFGGVNRYAGTPGWPKNITAEEYADHVAAGLRITLVYEYDTDDYLGGYAAGVTNAQALMADAANCGIPNTTPISASADEHLTAGNTAVAVAYQSGFYDTAKAAGWQGPVGAYGFDEFITAAVAAGKAEWTWRCGAPPAPGSGVTMWQRNGSDGQAAQTTVAGIACDISDQLRPFPAATEEDDMSTTPIFWQHHDTGVRAVVFANGLMTGEDDGGNSGQVVTTNHAVVYTVSDQMWQDQVAKSNLILASMQAQVDLVQLVKDGKLGGPTGSTSATAV